MKHYLIAALCCSAILSGCATIVHENTQDVVINSLPQGATLVIDNRTFTTPAVVPLKGKSEYPFTLTSPGYEPATGKVDSEFRIWSSVVGNIFNLSGLLGFAVDLWGTGSAYELQKSNTVTLRPLPQPVAAPLAAPEAPYGTMTIPAPAAVVATPPQPLR